jgi:hypothetical protein
MAKKPITETQLGAEVMDLEGSRHSLTPILAMWPSFCQIFASRCHLSREYTLTLKFLYTLWIFLTPDKALERKKR